MNCCRETVKMGVVAGHLARHASKARRAGHWIDECGLRIAERHKAQGVRLKESR